MKNFIIFLFSFFIFIGQINAQFRLGRNPQDPNRMPDPKKEIGIVLEKDSPIIRISGANGTEYKNFLSAGTLVIADKTTHIVKWVAICGNEVLFPKKWVPKGKILHFENTDSYKSACEEMFYRLESKVDKLQAGVNELLSRPEISIEIETVSFPKKKGLQTKSNEILLKLRLLLAEVNKKVIPPPPPTPPNSQEWTTDNTVGLLSSMALGAMVGGLGFMEVETTNNQYQFGTDGGEMLSAPGEERTVFRFNLLGAMAGVLVGGILYVLYNWL